MPICEPCLTVEEAFELLRSERRRRLLAYLLENEQNIVTREKIAQELSQIDSLDADTLETALAHLHLPKCADAGLVEYDHRSGAVRLTEGASDIKPLLNLIREMWESSDE